MTEPRATLDSGFHDLGNGKCVCYWYRDRAGFCWLFPLCGKRCPKTQAEADRRMEQLKQAMIEARERA